MKYTTREDFPKILPERKTFFCWNCRSINVIKENANDGRVSYLCNDCHVSSPRVLIYDKNMQQHFDNKNRLIHESCGVFLTNTKGEILLFKRVKYPYLLTIPAGHLEIRETPIDCAVRETFEEVGVTISNPKLIFSGDIEDDSCLGGADIHHWNAYMSLIKKDTDVKLDEEGNEWGWYNISDLNDNNTVQPVLMLIANDNVKNNLIARSLAREQGQADKQLKKRTLKNTQKSTLF